MKIIYQRARKIINYIAYLLVIIVISDVILFKHILNLGYPSHFKEDNIERYPAPSVEFTGKPNVKDHNELGFRGKSFRDASAKSIKIAFFGGSTGHIGNPPIAEIIERELQKLTGQDIFVANFSVISSKHRQHLHAMIEYLPRYEPDIIIFYGGFNETVQSAKVDPRPGYPSNFFYRGELSPFKKLLLENSAIFGLYDLKFGTISGIHKLRMEYQPYSDDWINKNIDNYFETLSLAKKISGIITSDKFKKTDFFAFYQPFQVPYEFIHERQLIRERIKKTPYVFDVSNVFLPLGVQIYTDAVHVKQPANDLMGKTIAKIIFEKAFKEKDDK